MLETIFRFQRQRSILKTDNIFYEETNGTNEIPCAIILFSKMLIRMLQKKFQVFADKIFRLNSKL